VFEEFVMLSLSDLWCSGYVNTACISSVHGEIYWCLPVQLSIITCRSVRRICQM